MRKEEPGQTAGQNEKKEIRQIVDKMRKEEPGQTVRRNEKRETE